jgi:DNA-binding NarL/FixJ family response regulator
MLTHEANGPRAAVRKVLVVDDHPLFRQALRAALETAFDRASVIDVESIEHAIRKLRSIGRFDLALLDLYLPGTTGFDGMLRLRKLFPRLPIVIVSGAEDRRLVREALNYGAAGFIPKSASSAEIASALRMVMDGAVYIPEAFRHCEIDPESRAREELAQRLSSLTRQQFAVLKMLRAGKLNKQIAYELGVSETTVKAHVSEVLRKMKVASRTQAVIEAGRIDFDQFTAVS